jgi:hypothetical protein
MATATDGTSERRNSVPKAGRKFGSISMANQEFPDSMERGNSRKLAHSIEEASDQLDVCPATIWKYAKLGKIRLIKIGGRTLMPDDELRRILISGV